MATTLSKWSKALNSAAMRAKVATQFQPAGSGGSPHFVAYSLLRTRWLSIDLHQHLPTETPIGSQLLLRQDSKSALVIGLAGKCLRTLFINGGTVRTKRSWIYLQRKDQPQAITSTDGAWDLVITTGRNSAAGAYYLDVHGEQAGIISQQCIPAGRDGNSTGIRSIDG